MLIVGAASIACGARSGLGGGSGEVVAERDAGHGQAPPEEGGPAPPPDAGADRSADAPVESGAADADADADACSTDCTTPLPTAPRPIAPLSTATATSQSPTFHWALAPGDDGAEVDICRDRPCSVIVTTLTAHGTSVAPNAPLAKGVYYWRLRGTAGGLVSADMSPVWELFIGAASAPVDTSWGTVLDVNGDGLADVGSTSWGPRALDGVANLYLGVAGTVATTAVALVNPAPATPGFGRQILSAGDVNGDGFGDVIVTTLAVIGDTNMGVALLYLGGPDGASPMPVSIAPPVAVVDFGPTAASAGDVNGDGYADVLLAYGNPAGGGTVYLYLGGPDGLTISPSVIEGSNLGFADSITGIGDVNGDGFADVAVGQNPVYVYFGGTSGLSSPTMVTLETYAIGEVVASAGDVNGDGYADLLVGEPDDDAVDLEFGAAEIFLGGSHGFSTTSLKIVGPSGTAGGFGFAAASVGDMNGDGFGDVVIGSLGENDDPGEAAVYFGGPGGISVTPDALVGPGYGEFGSVVSGAGDVDGDGYDDVVVGGYSTFIFLGGAGMPSNTSAAEIPSIGSWVASAGRRAGAGTGGVQWG